MVMTVLAFLVAIAIVGAMARAKGHHQRPPATHHHLTQPDAS
jgi:hypothetical protein